MKSLIIFVIAVVALGLCVPQKEDPGLGANIRRVVDLTMKFLNCSVQEGVKSPYFDKYVNDFKEVVEYNFQALQTDLNITKLKLHDIGKYEILKSDYNEETRHFQFEMKFDGPRLEGAYSAETQMNYSVFGLDLKAKYNFTVFTFPLILKVEWTFGKNDSTKRLLIEDFKYQFNIIDSDRLRFEKVASSSRWEESKIEENLVAKVKSVSEALKHLFDSTLPQSMNSIAKTYHSVDQLSYDLMDETGINFIYLHTCVRNASSGQFLDA